MPENKVLDSIVNVDPRIDRNKGSEGPKYDEDYNILNEEKSEAKEETEEESESEDVKETELEETKEESEESEESDEEKEIETKDIPYGRPTIREIKKEFPEFFTKFPELKEAIFREIEYTKLFPTVEDAKSAFTENEAFSVMSESALNGDSGPILESLEKTDKKALQAFSFSFLPNLYKRSQETYYDVVTPLFENMLRQAYKSNDENLKNSSLNIFQYLFGDKGDSEAVLKGEKTLSKNLNITEEQKKLQENRDAETSNRFRQTAENVSSEVQRFMKSLVLKDFDPDKVFTPFLRNQLAEEVVKRIDNALSNDNGHKIIMSARWKHAKQSNYSDDEKSKLISTYLARAKSLIGPIREKVRSQALGKAEKQSENKRKQISESVHKDKSGVGMPANGKPSKEKPDYRKMSDIDIFST